MRHFKHLFRRGDGVQVRIVIGYHDISRIFTFNTNGGVRNSYRLALAYRDATLKALGGDDRAKATHTVSKKSQGVIGVFVHKSTNGYDCWVSSCRVNGQWYRRYFSANKYGNEAAFQLACAYRYKRHNKPLRVVDVKKLPCLPDVPYIVA